MVGTTSAAARRAAATLEIAISLSPVLATNPLSVVAEHRIDEVLNGR
jgi:hypothetical protein